MLLKRDTLVNESNYFLSRTHEATPMPSQNELKIKQLMLGMEQQVFDKIHQIRIDQVVNYQLYSSIYSISLINNCST